MTNWEQRARGLLSSAGIAHFGSGPWGKHDYWTDALVGLLVGLGREMADARAEEIAQKIQAAARGHSTPHWLSASDHFQRLARSTIKAPEEPKPGIIMVDNPIHDILRRLELLEAKPKECPTCGRKD